MRAEQEQSTASVAKSMNDFPEDPGRGCLVEDSAPPSIKVNRPIPEGEPAPLNPPNVARADVSVIMPTIGRPIPTTSRISALTQDCKPTKIVVGVDSRFSLFENTRSLLSQITSPFNVQLSIIPDALRDAPDLSYSG
jgi:hypothetical protein